MGVLGSKLFTEGDPVAVKKLEDCATGKPTEVQSHFVEGKASGEHIRRLQEALANAKKVDPENLGDMPEFDINGTYDKRFADAIAFYKDKRQILNFAGKVDRVVGIKTCRALDSEATRRVQPPEPPAPPARKPTERKRALPNCVTVDEIPPSQDFSIKVLFFLIGGEIVEFSKWFITIRDNTNGISVLYLMRAGGLGSPSPIPIQGQGSLKEPKGFTTDKPTKASSFTFAQIAAFTSDVAGVVNETVFNIQYRGTDGNIHNTGPLRVDTGPINIPGAGAQTGPLSILSECQKKPGGTRRVITRDDLAFT